MIADLEASDLEELPEYDVCVVGSGPAGATLARELRGRQLRIAVLESGRDRQTPLGERLQKVVSEGVIIRDDSRVRVVGGASTRWAGLSAPLDRIDLQPRPWTGAAGWPIPYEELLGWYQRAAIQYRFPPPRDFEPLDSRLGKLRAGGVLRPVWERLEEKIFLAADPPQNFGTEWAETYADPTVDLWLDATLIELTGAGDPRRVTHGRIRTRGGRVRQVRARVFVLAAGAIENARVLLLSRDSWPAGLGNRTDRVGRYLMNHPKGNRGIVRFHRPVSALPYFFGSLHQGWAGYAGLRLRESEQASLGVLNSYVRLEPLLPWTDNVGVRSLVELVRRTGWPLRRWKASRRNEVVELRDWAETGDSALPEVQGGRQGISQLVLDSLVHSPRALQYLHARLFRSQPKIYSARIRNFMEMQPEPENRVMLSEVADEYGQPIPLVRHRPTELDRRSLIELHAALADELTRTGIGRLEDQLDDRHPWPIDLDASHHMGTTRMGANPDSSVVDPNLRLHEVENVYIAGSSVFPTVGCANPTYTIVALSIRLADHLLREVFGHGGNHFGSRSAASDSHREGT